MWFESTRFISKIHFWVLISTSGPEAHKEQRIQTALQSVSKITFLLWVPTLHFQVNSAPKTPHRARSHIKIAHSVWLLVQVSTCGASQHLCPERAHPADIQIGDLYGDEQSRQ